MELVAVDFPRHVFAVLVNEYQVLLNYDCEIMKLISRDSNKNRKIQTL